MLFFFLFILSNQFNVLFFKIKYFNLHLSFDFSSLFLDIINYFLFIY